MITEFIQFLKKYGVVGLAIAVIIGGKLNEFVNSLVNDLLMPLIFSPALKAAQVDDVRKLAWEGIYYGKVIGAGIDFLIVSLLVYGIAKVILREEQVSKK